MSAPGQHASLGAFRRLGDHFIGVDSDGCVFDTMEVKHKECFIPNIIQPIMLPIIGHLPR